jgi:transcriptional regulator with XRE-family HTH domain
VTSLHTAAYKRLLVKVREARELAGLTQVQAAGKLRTTQTFVSKCERGERRLDVIELNRFAKLYGKPLSWFVEDSD